MARKPGTPEHMKRIAKLAGRKKGTKNATTIVREQVFLDYKEKICRVMDQFFVTQMTLAKGLNYLWKIEKRIEGKGASAKVVKSKPMLVTDTKEMEEYLMGLVENVPMDEKGNTYFILTSDKPDASVMDSMIDRVFGRATQAVDFTSKGKSINLNDSQRTRIARRIIADNAKS